MSDDKLYDTEIIGSCRNCVYVYDVDGNTGKCDKGGFTELGNIDNQVTREWCNAYTEEDNDE